MDLSYLPLKRLLNTIYMRLHEIMRVYITGLQMSLCRLCLKGILAKGIQWPCLFGLEVMQRQQSHSDITRES